MTIPRLVVGPGAVFPGGHDGGEGQGLGAPFPQALSISQATCLSVFPGANPRETWRRTASLSSRARRMAASSAGAFTSRSSSTTPSRGRHSTLAPPEPTVSVRR